MSESGETEIARHQSNNPHLSFPRKYIYNLSPLLSKLSTKKTSTTTLVSKSLTEFYVKVCSFFGIFQNWAELFKKKVKHLQQQSH